jgi:hypothetical protein
VTWLQKEDLGESTKQRTIHPQFQALNATAMQFVAYRVHSGADKTTFTPSQPQWLANWRMNMNANVIRTNRMAALMVAVLMTLTVQGGMLWGFNAASQDTEEAQSSNVAVLETVTIVGRRV